MKVTDMFSRLAHMANLPILGYDDEWVGFMAEVLKMDGCYVPAAQQLSGVRDGESTPIPSVTSKSQPIE